MADTDLFDQIRITSNGAVCLGRSIVCDGFEPGLHAAVFTHIHRDHTGHFFEKCMHRYPVYASKITADLLGALKDDEYSRRTQFRAIDYKIPQSIRLGEHMDYLELLESNHMLGSSQVLLVTHEGRRILYSGDISPRDCPPKCDALVIDSTHGTPNLDKHLDSNSITRRIVDAVIEKIESQQAVCIHAHRGKLQELMHLLSNCVKIPIDVPFLTSNTDIRVAGVYKKYGYRIRDLIGRHDYEADKITACEYPWVEFTTLMKSTLEEREGRVSPITVNGRYGNTPVMTQDAESTWAASDEHAEFSDILKYVKEAEPEIVVTDASRTGHAETLARAIKYDLGIKSRHMPG